MAHAALDELWLKYYTKARDGVTPNKNDMKSKKLYRVRIASIEDGQEFPNVDCLNVVAEDAMGAAKKVRLAKTKKRQTFIEAIEKLHDIDKA